MDIGDYRVRPRRVRGGARGESGLRDMDSVDVDTMYDRHFQQKASMAEAMIYMMNSIRNLVWVLIVIGLGLALMGLFFIYRMW